MAQTKVPEFLGFQAATMLVRDGESNGLLQLVKRDLADEDADYDR